MNNALTTAGYEKMVAKMSRPNLEAKAKLGLVKGFIHCWAVWRNHKLQSFRDRAADCHRRAAKLGRQLQAV